MRQTTLSFLVILLTSLVVKSQNTIRVRLDHRMEDDKISKSLAILPVYQFQTAEVEPFTLFGVNEEKLEDRSPLVIRKMPDLSNMRDTGYTYIYFSGANTDINQGYCLTLIGNYRRSRKTIYFYIDRNNNLDFTDDGLPDSLTYMDEEVVVRLKNMHNDSAEHQLRLTRIKYGENMAYKKLLGDHFKKHSGTRIFTDINYCYREQRLNTIGGEYKTATDSFVLALKDMNNNGIFNESCMDKVYIGAVEDQVHTDEMALVLPDFEDVYFEWNQKRYQVINIDPTGQFIDIRQVQDPVLTKKLEVGKKIPGFTFVNLKNEKEDIRDYKKKPTYIFFWDEENISAQDTMYLGLITRELSDKLNVITLNHGDVPRNVRKYQYYNSIPWPMAFSSYQIGKLFYLESLNRGFLTSKRLKLANDRISPKQVYEKFRN